MKHKFAALSVALVMVLGPLSLIYAQAAKGVDEVDVVKASAKVEKIDLKDRKVTVMMDNGKKKTFKVNKDLPNLDQVQVGDTIKMKYTEETLITVGGQPGGVGAVAGQAVSVNPKGEMPGAVMVDTVAVQGKILAINADKPSVTVETPEGKKKTIKVSKNADLSRLKVGEKFDMVVTDSLVIAVTK
ncbi:MAG: hypothetical protein ABSD20_02850 [Terriglobales bacterium]